MQLKVLVGLSVLLFAQSGHSQSEEDDDEADEAIVSENSTETVPTTFSCPNGWQRLSPTQSCYYVSPANRDRKTWVDARNDCASKGARLLVLNSTLVKQFVMSILPSDPTISYWIGMSEFANEETNERLWRWSDGSIYNGTDNGIIKWDPGEPNNWQNLQEECVMMCKRNSTYIGLNDEECARQWPYICELPDEDYLEPVEWTCFNDLCCYASLKNRLYTYSDAKATCTRHNTSANLPVFNTRTNFFTFAMFQYGITRDVVTWLGYEYSTEHRQWQTHDRQTPQYWPSIRRTGYDRCTTTSHRRYISGWESADCEAKHTAVCQMCFEAPKVKPTEKCPTGWKYVDASRSCYYVSSERQAIMSQSQADCRTRGGLLLTLDDVVETGLVAQLMTTGKVYFIGLVDTNTSTSGKRNWAWTSGTPFDPNIVSWHAGEPNDHTNPSIGRPGEKCVTLDINQGPPLMNDVPCDNPFRPNFICKRNAEGIKEEVEAAVTCPNSKWQNRLGSPYCYYYSDHLANRTDAEKKCKSEGAELISFHSQEEITYIGLRAAGSADFKIAQAFWLGLKPFGHSVGRKWLWLDGMPLNKSELSLIKWLDGNQYSSESDSCVAIRNFREIRKINCGTNYGFPFVCSRPAMNISGKYVCLGSHWVGNDSLNVCYRNVTMANNLRNLSWSASHKYCISIGGILLTLHSAMEQHFLSNIVKRQEFYMLGLYSPHTVREDNYVWRWSDGMMFTESDSDIVKWQPGEPSLDLGENVCVAADRSFSPAMLTANCSDKLPFFCKINMGKGNCNGFQSVWSDCQASPACQPTCGNQIFSPSATCMQICQSGCVCAEGYVRVSLSNAKCIPIADCTASVSWNVTTSEMRHIPPSELRTICQSHIKFGLLSDSNCYRLIIAPMSYGTAEGVCEQNEGFLAVVNNKQIATNLAVLLKASEIPYAFVGLRRHEFENWNWGRSDSPKVRSASISDLPWLPDSSSKDRISATNAAVLSICENFSSDENDCQWGLIGASQDEEFPFICQFDLGPPLLQNGPASSIVTQNTAQTVAALAVLFSLTLLCCFVLLWMQLRRKERFYMMEEAIVSRLPPMFRRRSSNRSFQVDYANLLHGRGGD